MARRRGGTVSDRYICPSCDLPHNEVEFTVKTPDGATEYACSWVCRAITQRFMDDEQERYSDGYGPYPEEL